MGTYPLWLLLLGRYWLKGRAVRGSLMDVRRADMSSLRTSGIFLWGGPSDSESLPRPVERRRRQEGGVYSLSRGPFMTRIFETMVQVWKLILNRMNRLNFTFPIQYVLLK